jgi:sarcosine oxidase, subunit beta
MPAVYRIVGWPRQCSVDDEASDPHHATVSGERTRVVVVGAGVYGVGVAWELAKRGASVTVLEADDVASGASGGVGTRGVRSNLRSEAELPILKLAQDRWAELAESLGDPSIFRRIGEIEFYEKDADLDEVRAHAQLKERHGIPTRLVQGDELRALEPNLADLIVAALYCERDGSSDHTKTTRSLAAAAKRAGAEIRTGVRVRALVKKGSRIVAVEVESGERICIDGDLVLLANGGVKPLVAPLGPKLVTFDVNPVVLLTTPLREPPSKHLVGHATRPLHAKALADGRFMITGGFVGTVNDETGEGEVPESTIAANLAEAVRVYPMLEDVKIERAVADRFEAISPDRLPVFDRPPDIDNLWIGAGSSGEGWAPSPVYTALLAEWILERERPELLAPFAFRKE